MAETNFILTEDRKYLDDVRRITEIFVSLMQPKNLDGDNHKNPIIQFRLDFEELCIALQVNGVNEPQQMNVFQFYTALKYFDSKKAKQQPKKQ